jgi:hypothetical protein
VSYSAWHTPIACVEVVALFHPGFWPFPACPRAYMSIANNVSERKILSRQKVVMKTKGPARSPCNKVTRVLVHLIEAEVVR